MAAERTHGDFGSTLKAAREQRGVSLRQIANATKISVAALEALERNDISRLPGGIFSRAFVRSYALEVGLDPEQTIQEFAAQFPEISAAPGQAAAEQQEEEQVHESNQQTASTFVRLIVVSAAMIGLLLYYGSTRRPSPDARPSAPAAETKASTPHPSMPSPASGGASAPTSSGPSGDFPPSAGAGGNAPSASKGGQKPSLPAAAGKATTADPALPIAGASAETMTVGVVATGPCWVSAIVDGQRVVAREFQIGERMVFEVTRSVVLTAGDPAALAVTINGEEARSLGDAGQVVTVRLTPANFKEYLTSP